MRLKNQTEAYMFLLTYKNVYSWNVFPLEDIAKNATSYVTIIQ